MCLCLYFMNFLSNFTVILLLLDNLLRWMLRSWNICIYSFYKYALKVKVKSFSHVQLFVIPWTVAY